MKKIVVFGGAFNPPTNGHFGLAEQIINLYNIDKVIFLPVGDMYPKEGLLPADFRFNMLNEEVKNNHKFGISRVEITANSLLNTIDSLRIIQEKYPLYQISFLMGTDNLKQFPSWEGIEDLLEEFSFMVLKRNGDDMNQIIKECSLLSQYNHKFTLIENIIRNDISSTKVRKLLEENKSIRYLIPDSIYHYIEEYKLYR